MTQTEFLAHYDALAPAIYQFIFRKIWHQETAEDLAGQTWLQALEKIDQYQEDKGTFKSWVFQIARNLVIDHWRQKNPTADLDKVAAEGVEFDWDAAIDARSELQKVQEALAEFSPKQREVVMMRAWDNLSYREIAQVLGATEASCKMAFRRAVDKLRQIITLVLILTIFQF